MPPVTPTASTPPRQHRHSAWSEAPPPAYPYDYENSHHPGYSNRGESSPGGPPPPPSSYYPPYQGSAPPSDYWGSYEGSSYYDGPPRDRGIPPPHHRPYPYQQGGTGGDHRRPPPYGRIPSSPSRSAYNPPPPGHGYRGGESRPPPPPSRSYPPQAAAAAAASSGDDVPRDKKTGDPLSVLADVSAGINSKDGKKKQQQQKGHGQHHEGPGNEGGRRHIPIPAPTSPLQRRARPSPITPNQTPQEKSQQPRGGGGRPHPTPSNVRPPHEQHTPHPDYQPPDSGYADFQPDPYYSPRQRRGGGEYGGGPPAVVEHGSSSFDSGGHGEMPPYRDGPYSPKTPPSSSGVGHYYGDHPPPPPPPPPSYGGYWDSYQYPPPQHPGTPAGPHTPYPPPRWNYNMPHHQEPPPPYHHPDYRYDPHAPGDRPYPPPPYHHHHAGPPPPMPPMTHPNPAPYTYVQQPRLEEKTVLRKKFSWKHYPELERFLIANRDEYLKHSNMNYTAEQKQYNNWLTERLLEVAARHNYVFDPDDFNFVAIRDRIRCYYKSYVQTARKRGLKLPEKKDS